MRFLSKNNKYIKSQIQSNDLRYKEKGSNTELANLLLREQKNFCAYTEWYFWKNDDFHIDHFDDNLKNTEKDNYYNWYVVKGKTNISKPKLDQRFLPILNPASPELFQRIVYKDGIYQRSDFKDKEAKNLIDFIGANAPKVVEDREIHIDKLKDLREQYGNDDSFKDYLKRHKTELSFITAIQYELDLDLTDLI